MAARGGIGAGRSSKNVALVWLGWVHTTVGFAGPVGCARRFVRLSEMLRAGLLGGIACQITTDTFYPRVRG
jgi:hypothetical protein